MKKSELVDRLAATANITKAQAGQNISALKQIAETEIANGRSFEIHGIINLTVQTRAARTVRNPATGETFNAPEKRVVRPRVPKSLAAMAG